MFQVSNIHLYDHDGLFNLTIWPHLVLIGRKPISQFSIIYVTTNRWVVYSILMNKWRYTWPDLSHILIAWRVVEPIEPEM